MRKATICSIVVFALCCAFIAADAEDSLQRNFDQLGRKFQRVHAAFQAPAKPNASVLPIAHTRIKRDVKVFAANCPPGYTGSNCDNPICERKYKLLHHDGLADVGETIDSEYSRECDETYTFSVDQYINTVFISVTGLQNSKPTGTLFTPKGDEVTPTSIERSSRFGSSHVRFTYRNLAADYQYGEYRFVLSSFTRDPCMYTVQAPTELVIDGGFVTSQRDDNVQQVVPANHMGIARYPVVNIPSYFAFSFPDVLRHPAKPTMFDVYADAVSMEQDFNIYDRYHCSASAISDPFTCTKTAFYHAKIVGVDENGNKWQRIYDFECRPDGTPAPTPDPGPPKECLNGGTMVNDLTENATCYCGNYFEGRQCEIMRCFNDGKLGLDGRCQCFDGYSGTYCEDVQCSSQSTTEFNIDVRMLTFIVRTTTSMALQRMQIFEAATRIIQRYNEVHSGYFQRFAVVSIANGEVFMREHDTQDAFLDDLSNLALVQDQVCEDSLLAALSDALDSPSRATYTHSPIFVFSDGLSNDDDEARVKLMHQLSFWKGQVYFMLTDSVFGQKCKIDMADPGYRSLRYLAQFSHGLVSHVDTFSLANTTYAIAETIFHMSYLLSNDLLHSCSRAPKFQSFFIDKSVEYLYIVATGIDLAATLTLPDRTTITPQLYFHQNNTYIWYYAENVEFGAYMLSITGHAQNPCQYRVVARTGFDLFVGVSETMNKDALFQQPTWNKESHLAARITNVNIPDHKNMHAEMIIHTNEGEGDTRTVLYASNGYYRDRCDYFMYFGAWKCRTPEQFFYINVFLTDNDGYTILRTATGFCSPIPPTSSPTDDCQNGGIPFANETKCLCPAHFSGDKCENIQCLNLGTPIGSTCTCIAGFTGPHCETTSCFERNQDVNWSPNGRSLTFIIHDSIATRSSIRTLTENVARVLQNTAHQHAEWITHYQVMRFNDTSFETVSRSPSASDCIQGINSIYQRNIHRSEVSCANLTLVPALNEALRDPQLTTRGIFFIFLNGFADIDVIEVITTYELLENTKAELNIVLLTGSPCGESMDEYETKTLMNFAQFSDGQFIMSMPSNAGKVVHSIPTFYRSNYVYENFVSDCSSKPQTFYFPVDSQTQSFTTYIAGDLLEEPVYYSPNTEKTERNPGQWNKEYPYNLWYDIGMGSRMDQIIQQCSPLWELFDSRCWKFGMIPYDWYTAQADCHKDGAVMATIFNAKEQAFIDFQVGDVNIWIGLNDEKNTNNWMWDQLNNEVLPLETTGYKNWAEGQPNTGTGNHCVYDSHSGKLGWINTKCSGVGSKMAYICMKHAYNSDFEASVDDKSNLLKRGIWKVNVQTYEGPCYIQIFAQTGIELHREYTTAIHNDKGYPGPLALAGSNRIISHTTNQQWAGQGVEGHLQYAHMYSSNLTIIQAQRYEHRDPEACAYEYVSSEFRCPDVTFLTMSTGVDRYGYLYQRIHQVMCLTGPVSPADCRKGSVLSHGECVCAPGYRGMFCDEPICTSKGYLSESKTMCVCYYGWIGEFCNIAACKRDGPLELPTANNRTFIVALDGCNNAPMAAVIGDIENILKSAILKTHDHPSWFTHFTGVVFRELDTGGVIPTVSETIESDTEEDFITRMAAEAKKEYTSQKSSRAVIHGMAHALESDFISPRSEMFVITSGNAEDYASETVVMDSISRKRVYVNFLIVGDQTAPGGVDISDPSVEAYYNIADMSGGNYYQVEGTAAGLQTFWGVLVSTMYDTYYISKITRRNCSDLVDYLQVGANTSDILIDAFAQIQPKIVFTDADGKEAQSTEIATSNMNHIIYANTDGEPGLWTIRVDQGMPNAGYCTLAVRGQSSMIVQIGFTQDVGLDGGYHSDSVSLYPVFGSGNAITATTNVGTLLFAQVFSADERVLLWASPLMKRVRCTWPYISTNIFTCPAPFFVVAVDGEDFEGHPFRRMIHIHCIGTFVTEEPPVTGPTTPSPSPISTVTYPTCDPNVPIFDVYLVFDGSEEMPADEYVKVIQTMREIPRHVTIGHNNTRFIVASYSDSVRFLAGTTFDTITDTDSFSRALAEYEQIGYSGVTGNNIQAIYEAIDLNLFRTDGERMVIFFSSVGWDKGNQGQGFEDPTEKARTYRRAGIGTIAVGYGPRANETQLRAITGCTHMAATNEELQALLPYLMSVFCMGHQTC